jgi:hypothetical protein
LVSFADLAQGDVFQTAKLVRVGHEKSPLARIFVVSRGSGVAFAR